MHPVVPLLALALVTALAPYAAAGGGGHGLRGPDVLAPGASLEMAFPAEGTFTYYCRPHPDMRVTIVVSEQGPSFDGAVPMDLEDFSFIPGRMHLRPGAVVQWTNRDEVTHTVTPFNSTEAPSQGDAPIGDKGVDVASQGTLAVPGAGAVAWVAAAALLALRKRQGPPGG